MTGTQVNGTFYFEKSLQPENIFRLFIWLCEMPYRIFAIYN